MDDELYADYVRQEVLDLPPWEKIELAKALDISYFTLMNKAYGRGNFSKKQLEKYREWKKK